MAWMLSNSPLQLRTCIAQMNHNYHMTLYFRLNQAHEDHFFGQSTNVLLTIHGKIRSGPHGHLFV
jgi:hypothetical protein